MLSPDNIVHSIKGSLVRSAPLLARALAQAASVNAYRDSVCAYVRSATSVSFGRQWLDTLGWVYAGVHLASELFPDYVSLTFSPDNGRQDKRAMDYLNGRGSFTPYTFTRFLWPEEEGLRNKLINPLEIRIEHRGGQLASLLEDVQPYEQTESESHSQSAPRENVLTSIVVPYKLKEKFRNAKSAQPTAGSLRNRAVRGFLATSHLYLQQHFPDLENNYSVSDTQLYEAVCNTLLLHKYANVDPQTVIFFPLVVGLSRIGVFCFVTSGFLGQEDRTRLQSIAETTMLNIHAVDAMLAGQRDETIRQATFSPMLAHHSRSYMFDAANKIVIALDHLKSNEIENAVAQLSRAREGMKRSETYLRVLEEGVYEEVLNLRTTPTTLQRKTRYLIPPEYVNRVEWKVSGTNRITLSFSAAVLAEAIAQLIMNGLKSVETTTRNSKPVWCEVSFISANKDSLVVSIRDIGPGLTKDQEDSLMREEFEALRSSRQGGYGIKTTKWTIWLFGGTIDLKTGRSGTRWTITIPHKRSAISRYPQKR